MIVSLIAAMARNRVIGRAGVIPWDLPADRQKFRAVTMGHPVIMGRKTYESIGRPLPGRENIILTRQADYAAPGCRVVRSLEEALAAAGGAEEVFIAGGGEVYLQALPLAQRLYLTLVDAEPAGDAFFPEFLDDFVETGREELVGQPPASFVRYERRHYTREQ